MDAFEGPFQRTLQRTLPFERTLQRTLCKDPLEFPGGVWVQVEIKSWRVTSMDLNLVAVEFSGS